MEPSTFTLVAITVPLAVAFIAKSASYGSYVAPRRARCNRRDLTQEYNARSTPTAGTETTRGQGTVTASEERDATSYKGSGI